MADVDAERWNAIFYNEANQDVQLTNQLYEERYGKTGTTVGYTNTVDNPATTANPANMSAQAYNTTPKYINADGTEAGYNTPINPQQGPGGSGSTGNTGTTDPTAGPGNTGGAKILPVPETKPPDTKQGQIPDNAQTDPQKLLKEFLESDPDLMLNMVANHFRDMGASNVFMQWFVGNFRNFWGRYLGYVAEQAAGGSVPTLSFVDWVSQFDVNNSFYAGGGARQGSGQTAATFSNYVKAQGAQ